MQRMKIGLIAAVVLAGLSVLFYFVITDSLKSSVRQRVGSRVERAQKIYSDYASDDIKLTDVEPVSDHIFNQCGLTHAGLANDVHMTSSVIWPDTKLSFYITKICIGKSY